MLEKLTKNWWVVLVRGLAAVIFGVLAFLWPGLTLAVLVLMFGAYALVDGVFAVIAALRMRHQGEKWGWLLLAGVAGIALGLLTFIWPGLTVLTLLFFIAARAIITGVLEIATAVRLRREIEGEWLLVLSGILSVLFGVVLVLAPGAGALAFIWLIAAVAVVVGVLLIGLSLRLRGLKPASA